MTLSVWCVIDADVCGIVGALACVCGLSRETERGRVGVVSYTSRGIPYMVPLHTSLQSPDHAARAQRHSDS